MREPTPATVRRLIVVLAVLLLPAGCIRTPTQTELMRQTQATTLTTTQLRLAVRSFLDDYTGAVQDAADTIREGTEDADLRRKALLWKANAIPAGQKAVFQYDPLAALVDIWVLCEQQSEFFSRGAGRDLFGAWQGTAIDVSSRLVVDVVELAKDVTANDDQSDMQGHVDAWVAKSPIESLAFSRSSPKPVLARLLDQTTHGTSAVIGGLNESLADLSERLAVYGSQMPELARWQAELVVDEVMRSDDVQLALNNTSSLADSLERTATGLEELPEDVTEQVVSSLGMLRQERAILTRFVEEQRLATQEFVRQERTAIVEAVRRERQEALATVGVERVDTLDRMDQLATGLMEQSTHEIRNLIDHTLWRVTMMLAVLIVLGGVLGIIALRVVGVGR
jgi:hypothetical protein